MSRAQKPCRAGDDPGASGRMVCAKEGSGRATAASDVAEVERGRQARRANGSAGHAPDNGAGPHSLGCAQISTEVQEFRCVSFRPQTVVATSWQRTRARRIARLAPPSASVPPLAAGRRPDYRHLAFRAECIALYNDARLEWVGVFLAASAGASPFTYPRPF